MLRIAIADDHALFRQGLRSVLRLEPDVSVVAEADRIGDVMPMLQASPADVLLLDLQMDRSALVDVPALAAVTKVVVVTATERPDEALAALRAGARAVVFKRFAFETLMEAIRAVASGSDWLPAELREAPPGNLPPPQTVLTARECQIVRLVALGLRNAEVARRLFLSEQTVKTHLNNVFHKLGIRDRVELALYAVRVGLVGAHDRPA